MLLITFALPEESRDFLSALQSPVQIPTLMGPPDCPLFCGTLRGVPQDGKPRETPVAVFETGMGDAVASQRLGRLLQTLREPLPESARLALRQTEPHLQVDGVVVSGFAGALDPSLPFGHLVLSPGEREADGPLAERAKGIFRGRVHVGPTFTADTVLDMQEKTDCFQKTGALAVEMENRAVAAFAGEFGAPFLSLRVISDVADEPLPIPGEFCFGVSGNRARELALLAYLALRPGRWVPFARFARNIKQARRTVTGALRALALSF